MQINTARRFNQGSSRVEASCEIRCLSGREKRNLKIFTSTLPKAWNNRVQELKCRGPGALPERSNTAENISPGRRNITRLFGAPVLVQQSPSSSTFSQPCNSTALYIRTCSEVKGVLWQPPREASVAGL
ncbi:hypothetical protein SKAU_G00311600 [Synaphobranchus kaupii]|uniref:Uncharacterized protein n=1 Tax=Synaphobranchus kaupii TaxID=118154 RepID=A0A9Q1ERT9_SYNKA|nr:hypothetical protein SKAU_G00311600 [Synaphobranchus kaupii]